MAKKVNGVVHNMYNNATDSGGYAIPPLATNLALGQLVVNTSESDPCVLFKTSAGKIVKIVSEEVITKALTDILGNSAADLDTLRELIAQFEGSANDILPMLVALTDRVSAAETALGNKANSSVVNAHINNTSNPHGVTASQVGLGNVRNIEQLGKSETAADSAKLNGIHPSNYFRNYGGMNGVNIDNIDIFGFYQDKFGATGTLPTTQSNDLGILNYQTHSTGYYTQFGLDSYNNKAYLRFKHNNKGESGFVWSPWRELYHSGNAYLRRILIAKNQSSSKWYLIGKTVNNHYNGFNLTVVGNGVASLGNAATYKIQCHSVEGIVISRIGSNGSALRFGTTDGTGREKFLWVSSNHVEFNNISITEDNAYGGAVTYPRADGATPIDSITTEITINQVWDARNSNRTDVVWRCSALATEEITHDNVTDQPNSGWTGYYLKYGGWNESQGDCTLISTVGGSKGKAILSIGNAYSYLTGGNMGFGTNNPTDRVHAVGNVRATEKGIFGGNVESNGSGIFTGDIISKKFGAVVFAANDQAAGSATRLNDLQDVKLPANLAAKMVLAYDPAQTNADGTTGGYTFLPSAGTGTGKIVADEIESLPDLNLIGSTYVAASDKRLKENIRPLTGATNILLNFAPKEYEWNEEGKKMGLTDPRAYGLIAQEAADLKDIVDIVRPMGNSDYLGVDYVKIIPILIAGFQEQHKELGTVNRKIESIRLRANKSFGMEDANAKKIETLEAEVRELKKLMMN